MDESRLDQAFEAYLAEAGEKAGKIPDEAIVEFTRELWKKHVRALFAETLIEDVESLLN